MFTSKVPGDVMTGSGCNWDHFISSNLLDTGFFAGVALVTANRTLSYSFGSLQHINEVEIKQIERVFTAKNTDVPALKLCLKPGSSDSTTFRIYHHSHISAYATSDGNRFGLTISSVPQGVFLTLFKKPTRPSQVICAVEKFTDKLRL